MPNSVRGVARLGCGFCRRRPATPSSLRGRNAWLQRFESPRAMAAMRGASGKLVPDLTTLHIAHSTSEGVVSPHSYFPDCLGDPVLH